MQCNQDKNVLTITHGPRTMKLSYGKDSPLASGQFPYLIKPELLFKLFDINVKPSSSELEELSKMQEVYNFPQLKVFPNMGEMNYLDFKFLVLNEYLVDHPQYDFESFLLQALHRNDLLVLQKAHDNGICLTPPTNGYPFKTYDFRSLEVLKWLVSNDLLFKNKTFLMERCFVSDLDDCLQYLLDQGFLSTNEIVDVPFRAPKCNNLLKRFVMPIHARK